MAADWVDTPLCRLRLRSEGIFEMRYNDHVDHTLADAKREVAKTAEMIGDGAPVPLLVVVGGLRRQEHAAREFLTRSHEVAALFRRTALVVSTPVARVLATIFTRLQSPRMEVRVFGDEPSALDWLREVAEP